MENKIKISQLPLETTLKEDTLIPIVQDNSTKTIKSKDLLKAINDKYNAIDKKIESLITNPPQSGGNGSVIDDNVISSDKVWSSSKTEDFVLNNVGAIWQEINGGQMVIDSSMDGFLREVEILGNTIQNSQDLSNIQHLGIWNEEKQGYEIEICVSNSSSKDDLNYQEFRTTIILPCQLMKVGNATDRLYWDSSKGKYVIEKNIDKTQLVSDKNFANVSEYRNHYICYYNRSKIPNVSGGFLPTLQLISTIPSGIGSSTVTDTVGVAWGNNDCRLLVSKSVINDISEARGYFNSFSPYVYYPLATPQLIDTDIREEIKLPTFINNTYLTINGGIQGSIKAKVPVDGGKVIGVLQEENIRLKSLIDTTILTIDQVYNLLEPLVIDMLADRETINPLVNMYISMVEREPKTIDRVPEKYREQVNNIISNKESI